VIGFQYSGKLVQLTSSGEKALSASGVTGLLDRYRLFRNAPDTGTVLVYFREAGAAAFFKEPLHELFRESLGLDHFLLRSELLLFEEQLCEARTDADRIRVTEAFLLSRLRPVAHDPLVIEALRLIHLRKGDIRIRDLAEQLHISLSPLEKRFRQTVGASPKKFASIIRLNHLLQQYDPNDSLAGMGYESGFYDQAHFIRTFRDFTGETPEAYFRGKKE
jgi:AraC-like DNA-binding protein